MQTHLRYPVKKISIFLSNLTLGEIQQLLCEWVPRICNLETLILSRCWSNELRSLSFQRLKRLKVQYYGRSSLFAFSDFKRLQQLEELEISGCAFLEEIVEDDEISSINKKTITLFHLKKVFLRDLPNLKSFIQNANHAFLTNLCSISVSNCGLPSLFMCSTFGSLQRLEKLEVQDCRLFEGIFEYTREDETSNKSEQIFSLSKLSSLELGNLPDLISFIHGANYDCYMPALWYMGVDNYGFSTLFKCSVFKSFQQLGALKVLNCRLLEGIVEDARGGETSATNDNTITFPQLWWIELKHLPNLKSFSRTQSYAFNIPELKYFRVVGCPRVENFTCLNTNTGRGYVYTDGPQREEASDLGYVNMYGQRWIKVPYLKEYIKRMIKEEVSEVTVLEDRVMSDQV